MVHLKSYIFIYHPLFSTRHRRDSAAAGEPDSLISSLARAWLSACASINLSASGQWPHAHVTPSPKVAAIKPWTAEVKCFSLTFKARDKAGSALVFWAGSIPTSPIRLFLLFFLRSFLGFLLLCPHVLCISLHAPPFICLLFVTLSSSLMTAILSL